MMRQTTANGSSKTVSNWFTVWISEDGDKTARHLRTCVENAAWIDGNLPGGAQNEYIMVWLPKPPDVEPKSIGG
jgi:hypothetical protein